MDECAMNICSEYATCINTEGSFSCSCSIGYHGDGFNCYGKFSKSTISPIALSYAFCMQHNVIAAETSLQVAIQSSVLQFQ